MTAFGVIVSVVRRLRRGVVRHVRADARAIQATGPFEHIGNAYVSLTAQWRPVDAAISGMTNAVLARSSG